MLFADQPGDIYTIDFERMVKRYNPTGESLFKLEKEILESLAHPGTVSLLGEFTSDDKRWYFVMKRNVYTIKRMSEEITENKIRGEKIDQGIFLNRAIQMA